MSDPQPTPVAPGRWKRPASVIVVAAALAMVLFAWFHTPEVQVQSDTEESGYATYTCANAGPSRWKPPTVRTGQELSSDQNMATFNQQVLKHDIEALEFGITCAEARDRHTNILIVTTFAAGAVLFFGYVGLWKRRDRADPA